MRVADKLTPEPIMSCFHNQGKSQMLATPRVVYMAQMKVRQALEKSRNFVKTMIYIP